ncbi:MAG: sigma-54 dependent transcriptional regulator [Sphingorhabdus sp.]
MTLNIVARNTVYNSQIDDQIVGNHADIQSLRNLIGRVASSSASVMITGASGSGKEVVARAIHDASNRSNKPFVAINCGAIPAELIESELFGHERGSFTGAQARRIGRFEEADGGTLFLDEIGDMRFDMQVKLLRVLEERMISRVGGNGAIPVDVRIICATHQDIDAAITENRFREDLFFRLSVVPVHVPDLASRACDIPLLVAHFQKGKPSGATVKFTADGMKRLQAHGWPGNVRELRNVVERGGVLHGGQMLGSSEVEQLLNLARKRQVTGQDFHQICTPVILPADLVEPASIRSPVAVGPQPVNLKDMVETVEIEQIRRALEAADGVISEAARLLTLKRTTLIEKIRKYGFAKSC